MRGWGGIWSLRGRRDTRRGGGRRGRNSWGFICRVGGGGRRRWGGAGGGGGGGGGGEWEGAVRRVEGIGCAAVVAFNPYWDRLGRTYEDPDGYRVVLWNGGWGE